MFVKNPYSTLTAALVTALLLSHCVNQEIAQSVESHVVHEGKRYSSEVDAQSPFKPLTMTWKRATDLMANRNLSFLKAQQKYQLATARTPKVKQVAVEVKKSVGLSLANLMTPKTLTMSSSNPLAVIPKQFKSIASLKNISHSMEQTIWEKTGDSLDAELEMRKKKVELNVLLHKGAVIDRELARVDRSLKELNGPSEKFKKELVTWRASLRKDREAWLNHVRDFFNAEYYDVHFIEDGMGLPLYRSTDQPNLKDWKRWCNLTRSRNLVKTLKKNHEESKPLIPGTMTVANKISGYLHRPIYSADIDTNELRSEIRSLIRNWRGMKRTQSELARIPLHDDVPLTSLQAISMAKRRYQLHQQEIQHASKVWIFDEECWKRDIF